MNFIKAFFGAPTYQISVLWLFVAWLSFQHLRLARKMGRLEEQYYADTQDLIDRMGVIRNQITTLKQQPKITRIRNSRKPKVEVQEPRLLGANRKFGNFDDCEGSSDPM